MRVTGAPHPLPLRGTGWLPLQRVRKIQRVCKLSRCAHANEGDGASLEDNLASKVRLPVPDTDAVATNGGQLASGAHTPRETQAQDAQLGASEARARARQELAHKLYQKDYAECSNPERMDVGRRLGHKIQAAARAQKEKEEEDIRHRVRAAYRQAVQQAQQQQEHQQQEQQQQEQKQAPAAELPNTPEQRKSAGFQIKLRAAVAVKDAAAGAYSQETLKNVVYRVLVEEVYGQPWDDLDWNSKQSFNIRLYNQRRRDAMLQRSSPSAKTQRSKALMERQPERSVLALKMFGRDYDSLSKPEKTSVGMAMHRENTRQANMSALEMEEEEIRNKSAQILFNAPYSELTSEETQTLATHIGQIKRLAASQLQAQPGSKEFKMQQQRYIEEQLTKTAAGLLEEKERKLKKKRLFQALALKHFGKLYEELSTTERKGVYGHMGHVERKESQEGEKQPDTLPVLDANATDEDLREAMAHHCYGVPWDELSRRRRDSVCACMHEFKILHGKAEGKSEYEVQQARLKDAIAREKHGVGFFELDNERRRAVTNHANNYDAYKAAKSEQEMKDRNAHILYGKPYMELMLNQRKSLSLQTGKILSKLAASQPGLEVSGPQHQSYIEGQLAEVRARREDEKEESMKLMRLNQELALEHFSKPYDELSRNEKNTISARIRGMQSRKNEESTGDQDPVLNPEDPPEQQRQVVAQHFYGKPWEALDKSEAMATIARLRGLKKRQGIETEKPEDEEQREAMKQELARAKFGVGFAELPLSSKRSVAATVAQSFTRAAEHGTPVPSVSELLAPPPPKAPKRSGRPQTQGTLPSRPPPKPSTKPSTARSISPRTQTHPEQESADAQLPKAQPTPKQPAAVVDDQAPPVHPAISAGPAPLTQPANIGVALLQPNNTVAPSAAAVPPVTAAVPPATSAAAPTAAPAAEKAAPGTRAAPHAPDIQPSTRMSRVHRRSSPTAADSIQSDATAATTRGTSSAPDVQPSTRLSRVHRRSSPTAADSTQSGATAATPRSTDSAPDVQPSTRAGRPRKKASPAADSTQRDATAATPRSTRGTPPTQPPTLPPPQPSATPPSPPPTARKPAAPPPTGGAPASPAPPESVGAPRTAPARPADGDADGRDAASRDGRGAGKAQWGPARDGGAEQDQMAATGGGVRGGTAGGPGAQDSALERLQKLREVVSKMQSIIDRLEPQRGMYERLPPGHPEKDRFFRTLDSAKSYLQNIKPLDPFGSRS